MVRRGSGVRSRVDDVRFPPCTMPSDARHVHERALRGTGGRVREARDRHPFVRGRRLRDAADRRDRRGRDEPLHRRGHPSRVGPPGTDDRHARRRVRERHRRAVPTADPSAPPRARGVAGRRPGRGPRHGDRGDRPADPGPRVDASTGRAEPAVDSARSCRSADSRACWRASSVSSAGSGSGARSC